MDITFTDRPTTHETVSQWSLQFDRQQITNVLLQAAQRATQTPHEILASITLPVTTCDPLSIFQAFKQLNIGERFFWARPSEQRALVGVGTATRIETEGPERVTQAATAWRKLHQQAVVVRTADTVPAHTSGPVFFGGFTFDTLNTRTELWQEYADGLLILPTFLYHHDQDYAALTINVLVRADSNIYTITQDIEETLSRLPTALQETSQQITAEPLTSPEHLAVQDLLPAEVWKNKVANAVQSIRNHEFKKVVLARGIQVTNTERDFEIEATLQQLRQSYPKAYVFAIQRDQQYFVGATPERLVCGMDGQLQTMALAGSAPRGNTDEEDEHLGRELLNSHKNQGEHQVVVDTIQNALSALCSRVWTADAPHLLKMKNIQHLETPIMGDLLPGRSILEAIEDLHPTPAVGGYPRDAALAVIRDNEELDRGWYASPVGWIGTSGNGEFAVALRSGLIAGNQATLFAGCGIVADSDPESEYQESCLKLQVMLRSLSTEK